MLGVAAFCRSQAHTRCTASPVSEQHKTPQTHPNCKQKVSVSSATKQPLKSSAKTDLSVRLGIALHDALLRARKRSNVSEETSGLEFFKGGVREELVVKLGVVCDKQHRSFGFVRPQLEPVLKLGEDGFSVFAVLKHFVGDVVDCLSSGAHRHGTLDQLGEFRVRVVFGRARLLDLLQLSSAHAGADLQHMVLLGFQACVHTKIKASVREQTFIQAAVIAIETYPWSRRPQTQRADLWAETSFQSFSRQELPFCIKDAATCQAKTAKSN